MTRWLSLSSGRTRGRLCLFKPLAHLRLRVLVQYVWNIPWAMKTTGNMEKGVLRQALAGILPDDARNRKKSAYPSSQNPAYLEALRTLTLQILNDPSAPVQPLINAQVVRTLVEGIVPGVPEEGTLFLLERIIQTNAWLKEYHVTVSL